MLPSTWTGQELRIVYTDCCGSGQATSGILLDMYPVGPVLNIRGARKLISWDRLAMIELVAG
jgi:hypothetical protein